MDTGHLFAHDGVTFRTSRAKVVLFGLCMLAILALATVCALYPEIFRSNRAAVLRVGGWACIVLCLVGLAAAVIGLARPAIVQLSPNGLTIKAGKHAYTAPWSALSNFRIRDMRGYRSVCFDDERPTSAPSFMRIKQTATGATMGLPPFMNVSPDHLAEVARDAKTRWEVR